MLRSRFTSVRRRISSLLGLPQIHLRLDQLEHGSAREEELRQQNVDRLSAEIASLDRHLAEQFRVGVLGAVQVARDHTDASVAEHSAHALALAQLHTEQAITAALNTMLSDLRAEATALADHAVDRARDHTEQAITSALRNEASALADAAVDRAVARLQPELSVLRRRVESAGLVGSQPAPQPGRQRRQPAKSSPASVDPVLYAAVEDVFRGSSELVAERQLAYLSHVQDVVDDEHPLVDLGCGRGEWLAILDKHGVPARGVDSNPIFVAEVREQGLAADEDDLLEVLRSAPDDSLGAVTMFQVLEHLPFPMVVDVIQSARRVLRPGGVLIAEVPNSKNLRVGAGSFWIDPTHERPWYPDVLEFLARSAGFATVDGLYSNPAVTDIDVSGVPANIAALIDRLVDAVDGAQDYALIARA